MAAPAASGHPCRVAANTPRSKYVLAARGAAESNQTNAERVVGGAYVRVCVGALPEERACRRLLPGRRSARAAERQQFWVTERIVSRALHGFHPPSRVPAALAAWPPRVPCAAGVPEGTMGWKRSPEAGSWCTCEAGIVGGRRGGGGGRRALEAACACMFLESVCHPESGSRRECTP